MRTAMISLATLAMLCLCACPSKKEEGGSGATKGPNQQVAGSPTASQESPVAVAPSDTGEEATAQTPNPTEIDAIPENGEILGEWFALLGTQFSGPHQFTSDEGHTLVFDDAGSAVWIMKGGGREMARVDTRYRIEDSALVFTFSKSLLSQNSSLASTTPLGFGRDKEVGLDSASRDKEVGLSADTTGQSTQEQGDQELSLEMSSDGRYLGLKDVFGHIMVYGRSRNPGTALSPKIAGEWHGHRAPDQAFDAVFKVEGNKVSADFSGGKEKFRGEFNGGYIVGEISGFEGKTLAAMLVENEGTVNGVYTMEPFDALQLHFDFNR